MLRLVTRRPLLLAPLIFDTDVAIAELLSRRDRAPHLPGNANRRRAVFSDDGEHAERIGVEADGRFLFHGRIVAAVAARPEPRVPAAQVFAVEQGFPFGRE